MTRISRSCAWLLIAAHSATSPQTNTSISSSHTIGSSEPYLCLTGHAQRLTPKPNLIMSLTMSSTSLLHHMPDQRPYDLAQATESHVKEQQTKNDMLHAILNELYLQQVPTDIWAGRWLHIAVSHDSCHCCCSCLGDMCHGQTACRRLHGTCTAGSSHQEQGNFTTCPAGASHASVKEGMVTSCSAVVCSATINNLVRNATDPLTTGLQGIDQHTRQQT
jgi:hypothetical protein